MSNAFAAKRMAQVQIPRHRLFGRDLSMAQGYTRAMEKTLDLLEGIEHLMVQDTDPTSLEVKRRIHEFKERQYVAPQIRTVHR